MIDDQEKSFVDQVHDYYRHIRYPSSNIHCLSANMYAAIRADGHKTLFSGFGGDEAVSSGNYTMCSRELIRKGSWRLAIDELKSFGVSNMGVFKSFINAYFPREQKYEATENIFLRPELFEKWKPVDLYGRWFQDTKSLAEDYLCTMSFTSERLEESYRVAEIYGFEYSFPLLDIRLIQYYLSLPPEMKCHAGIKRYMIREAMKGLLPESIRLRDDKSVYTIPSDYRQFYNSLERDEFPDFDKDIFEVKKIDRFIEQAKNMQVDDKELDLFFQALQYQLYLDSMNEKL